MDYGVFKGAKVDRRRGGQVGTREVVTQAEIMVREVECRYWQRSRSGRVGWIYW